jgi:glycosyltransferase involved in cell wall biosynthesis
MKSEEIQIKRPRLEKPIRITEQVWPEGVMPVVSICCITYQHVNFLRDAIDGFLMQVTTFPVEIIIRDDASTDGTAEIVKEYTKKYPQLIRTILHVENQYSKGKRAFPETFDMARGEYIALCEGDDFWTCPSKLEKQVHLLEGDARVALTFHKAWVRHQDGHEDFLLQPSTTKSAYGFDDILLNGYFIQTASMVFRRSLIPELSDLSFFRSGDIVLQATLGHFGKILFLNETCSVYRKHDAGVTRNYSIQSHYIEYVRPNHFWGFYVLTRKLKGTVEYPALEAVLQSIVKEITDYYRPEIEGDAHILRQKVEACLDRERPPSVSASDQKIMLSKLLGQYYNRLQAKSSANLPSIAPSKLLQESQHEIVETHGNTSAHLMKHANELKNLLAKINPNNPRFPGVVPFLFLLNASRITRLLGEAVRELAPADQRNELANQNATLELKMALHHARFARFESRLTAIRLAEMQATRELSADDDEKKPLPLHFDTLKHWLYVLESDQPHEQAFEYFRKLAHFDISFFDIGANTGISALSIHKAAPQWPVEIGRAHV